MNKKGMIGILIGATLFTVACLCAPTGFLPLQWTATAQPTLALPTFTLVPPTPIVTPTDVPTLPVYTLNPDLMVTPACESGLAEELHKSETTFLSGKALETNFTLVKYKVSGDTLSDPSFIKPIPPDLVVYQNDTFTQEKMWKFFANIIPADERTEVTGFQVFTDGPSNSLGAVEQGDTPHDWILDMDIEDGQNFADLSSTLVHEFGHLLTLNDTQVTPDLQVFNNPGSQEIFDRAAQKCQTFFTFEGCATADSYLNQFFQSYWTRVYAEWKKIDSMTNSDAQDQKLDDFYQRHFSQFVSRYSVTSPQEDIAETFMYFIFTPKPAGVNVSEEKILFFYNYPEMVTLRGQILSHLYTYVEKP
jgi:hypothetical protein